LSAHNKKLLYPATVIATSTTTLSPYQLLPAHSTELGFIVTVSARTDGTYTVTLQHSSDGVNFYDLQAGTALSANGSNFTGVASTITHMSYVRASIVSATVTTGATVKVEVMYGTQRM
jgi:hypothetical protein